MAVPGKPTGLTAAAGDKQVTLTWTAASDNGSAITGYQVQRDGGAWGDIEGSGPNTTSHTVKGLTNGTRYAFRVRAANGVGVGEASDSASATLVGAPGAPGLSASPGNGQVTLTWTAASDNGSAITGYQVQRDGGAWTDIEDSGPDTTSHTVPGLTNGTRYAFRVRATNGVGAGSASDSASASPAGAPGAPGLSASPGNGQVRLTWTAASDNGSAITGYQVQRDGGAWNGISGSGANSTTHTVSGLTNGTRYAFRVRAVNRVGAGSASNRAAATPAGGGGGPVVSFGPIATPARTPGAPGGLSATPGDRQVTLTWTAASANGSAITRYQYQRDGGSWDDIEDSSATTTAHTVEGLTNGTRYAFSVRAVNGVGFGEASDSVSAAPAGTPGAPGSLIATPGDRQVTLTWTAASANGSAITGYQLQQDSGSWTDIAGISATTTTVGDLENGSEYAFRVRAVNGVGSGEASDSVSATPAGTPGAPGSLSATPGDRQVTLTWTAAAANGSAITGYQLQQDGGSWNDIAGSSATTTSYTKDGLMNGTPYAFSVRAVNGVGFGEASDSISVTVGAPGAPASLSATPGDGQVTLTWTAAADNGSAITRYQYQQDGGLWQDIDGSSATTTSYTKDGLTNGTSYAFKVRAVSGVGFGEESESVSATPAGTPGAPGSLSATPGDGQVTLTWTAAADNGSTITRYQYQQDGGSWNDIDGSSATTTSYTKDGLTNGTRYAFKVRAVNGVGFGEESESASATPAGTPGAPGSLSATPGDGQVTLTWTAAAAKGSAITKYQYQQDGGAWQDILGSSDTTTTVGGLTNGTLYAFKVRAVNGAGAGEASGSVSATAGTPGAPASLSAKRGDQQVTLTWTAAAANGSAITKYQYQQDGGSWIDIAGSPATTTAVGGLTNGTLYTFKVRAVNGAGEGEASDSASATPIPKPAAPTGLSATPGDRQVTLSWTDPGDPTITKWRYRIVRTGQGGSAEWRDVPGSTATTTSYVVPDLTNGTEYRFRILAVNDAGEGLPTPVGEVVTATPSG